MTENRINLELNIVFKDKFQEGVKYPWLKGYISVDDKVYETALWPVKSGKPNSFSGILKLKEETTGTYTRVVQPQKAESQQKAEFIDDDIPF